MKLAESPTFFESIANHSRVFPFVSFGPQERIELGDIWPECIGFEFPTGGWLMHRIAPGIYEAHTLFLPKSRDVLAKGRQVMRHMFTETDCAEIVGRIPDDLPHAKRMVRNLGLSLESTRKEGCLRHSGTIDMHYYSITKPQWQQQEDRT